MEIQDYARTLRTRWKLIVACTLVGTLLALTVSLLSTSIYSASTRLFVSASSANTVGEVYQGNLFSQQRVTTYADLLTGTALAQRAVDRLGTDESAASVASKVRAKAAPDTVLIDVTVSDQSPEHARDLVNALSTEFVAMVAELETPPTGGAPTARVVVENAATTPSKPVSPNIFRNVGLGLVVGLLLGIAAAIVRDRFDNTVKDSEDIEARAEAPVIGSVPFDKQHPATDTLDFSAGGTPDVEAFRELRTNLQFLSVDNPPKVIVVGSAMPNEAKTATALSLAMVLAEAGKSVVLVDADLRRPSVAGRLRLVGASGLTNVLAGQANIRDVLQQYRTISVLTAGSDVPNPSELIGSNHLALVFEELRTRFDYVVVDTPPLLPVSDATVLALRADGVLLLARYGKTRGEQLAKAASGLRSVGARVLGVVITLVPRRGATGYDYRYTAYNRPSPPPIAAPSPAATPAPAEPDPA